VPPNVLNLLTFCFGSSSDGKGAENEQNCFDISIKNQLCGHGCLHFWIVEMNDGAIVLDHVDFLNAGNVGHRQLFQVALKLFVIHCGRLVHNLLLPSSSSLFNFEMIYF